VKSPYTGDPFCRANSFSDTCGRAPMVEKFKQAARDLETDDDENRFDEKLGKTAR
jgi:hypothetical protein